MSKATPRDYTSTIERSVYFLILRQREREHTMTERRCIVSVIPDGRPGEVSAGTIEENLKRHR